MNPVETVEIFKGKSIRFSNLGQFIQKEMGLLLIVGIIGCLGTLFIFTIVWLTPQQADENAMNTITINKQEIYNAGSAAYSPVLQIEGNFIAHNVLKFTLEQYNPKATYKVLFGDGRISEFTSKHFLHQYDADGSYALKVYMQFRNDVTPIYERNLIIKENRSPETSTP